MAKMATLAKSRLSVEGPGDNGIFGENGKYGEYLLKS